MPVRTPLSKLSMVMGTNRMFPRSGRSVRRPEGESHSETSYGASSLFMASS
ncbi:Uncharacterised protein [Mycobacteroides abscessus subsp. abscessus]|nr:Uncharacterised protein [Mycobacteroides abscessus subsp. abscessus]